MNTQSPTNPVMICKFVVALPEADYTSEGSIYASSRDYGFDYDDDEIARELLAPLPAISATQTIPEVETEGSEKVFQYFLS